MSTTSGQLQQHTNAGPPHIIVVMLFGHGQLPTHSNMPIPTTLTFVLSLDILEEQACSLGLQHCLSQLRQTSPCIGASFILQNAANVNRPINLAIASACF